MFRNLSKNIQTWYVFHGHPSMLPLLANFPRKRIDISPYATSASQYALRSPFGVFDGSEIIRKHQSALSSTHGIIVALDSYTIKNCRPECLDRLDVPKIMILGDTQHGPHSGFFDLIDYVSGTQFDAVVFSNNPQHAHWFRPSPAPFFYCPLGFANPDAFSSPPASSKDYVVHVGSVSPEHAKRRRVYSASAVLAPNGSLRFVETKSNDEASLLYRSAAASLNVSLNSDLNFRMAEVPSAAGVLLTDRLGKVQAQNFDHIEPSALFQYSSLAELSDLIKDFASDPGGAIHLKSKSIQYLRQRFKRPLHRVEQLDDYVKVIDDWRDSVRAQYYSGQAPAERLEKYLKLRDAHQKGKSLPVHFHVSDFSSLLGLLDAADLPFLRLSLSITDDWKEKVHSILHDYDITAPVSPGVASGYEVGGIIAGSLSYCYFSKCLNAFARSPGRRTYLDLLDCFNGLSQLNCNELFRLRVESARRVVEKSPAAVSWLSDTLVPELNRRGMPNTVPVLVQDCGNVFASRETHLYKRVLDLSVFDPINLDNPLWPSALAAHLIQGGQVAGSPPARHSRARQVIYGDLSSISEFLVERPNFFYVNSPLEGAKRLNEISALCKKLGQFQVSRSTVDSAALVSQKKPLVSMIVSMFRAEEYLPSFLENICQQTVFSQCEFLVYDCNKDGKDESFLHPYLKKFSNIRYSRVAEDPGLYGIWNIGIEDARGDLVGNWNLDDRRHPMQLEILSSFLEDNPDISVASSWVVPVHNFDADVWAKEVGDVWYPGFPEKYGIDHLITSDGKTSQCVPHCMPLWRRSVHQRYGKFDESRYSSAADWEFWLRLASKGVGFGLVMLPLSFYYVNPRSYMRVDSRAEGVIRDLIERYGTCKVTKPRCAE